MQIKVKYNYLLWLLGFRKILPSDIIKAKKINENNEPLVELGAEFLKLNYVGSDLRGRKEVVEKLKRINEELKTKYKLQLAIVEVYRNSERYQENWNKRIENTRKKFPNFSEEEIIREASKFSVKPNGNGPHQTGGAVDLTLADLDGNIIFMGSDYSEQSEKSFFDSKNISKEARKYREILKEVMEEEDFNNYPAEWWHWSYGDKMWAAYKKKPYAIYGLITELAE